MASDAGLLVRRRTGDALTVRQVATALGLPDDPSAVRWQRTTGPDGSLFGLRMSTEPGDLLGPAVGESSAEWPAERPYDCYLHVTIDRTAGEDGDSTAALRAFCRSAVSRLHGAWPGLETAFGLDADGSYSYRIDPREVRGTEIELWLGSAAQPAVPLFSPAGAADRSAAADRPGPRFHACPPGRFIPDAESAGDAVTETLALRAGRPGFRAAARTAGWSGAPEALPGFTERLLTECGAAFEEFDLALWVDGRLCRNEVAVRVDLP
ncbi:hypothetical protein [Kitasatospora sp. MBT63]|uniref:hypothetical protein n=1 Tax=Kitasatospora sp. MBT63 TaxID=1444768 RepID=UPI00053B69CC|nr:hypothetical protein [Kitasatospora sp. MBT63]